MSHATKKIEITYRPAIEGTWEVSTDGYSDFFKTKRQAEAFANQIKRGKIKITSKPRQSAFERHLEKFDMPQ